ncbi:NUDIX hydrolase [Streptomyces sp. NPDC058667]|uniref:NUDIX hydrolase n=1 Tax=Streptomyces sp. NPDC058667 TaxID=3346588 RepID=UPI00365A19E6
MPSPAAVEFLAYDVAFVQDTPPALTPWERSEVDRLWVQTRALTPETFDGPLAVTLGVDSVGSDAPVVRWAAMTYRDRALRRLWPAERVPGSLFVTVLLPTESGLVVGRGSPTTAAPGRWTLPGGAAEPPPSGAPLDIEVLRRHAARELAEEIGIHVDDKTLRLWALTRGNRFGSLGFHFLCPRTSSALVRGLHSEQSVAQVGHGVTPELDEIDFVPSPIMVSRLGPTADYLPQVVDRYFTADRLKR